MIVFDLACENSHRFEGWFASSEDYERQQREHLLNCPFCASTEVRRLPAATRVNTGRGEREIAARSAATAAAATPGHYANFDTALMLKLIAHVVENTEDVGRAFAEEARRIHYKEAPERHIRGTALPQEVEALREEGIDVVALPVPPHLAAKPH
jgi:hypothetical protein